MKPVLTKVLAKFQLTIPQEIRTAFGLVEGDLLEWNMDSSTGIITIIPKRAQLLTPLGTDLVEAVKKRRLERRESSARSGA
jgi:AbrB family looped-hinge helix DNA binding protein